MPTTTDTPAKPARKRAAKQQAATANGNVVPMREGEPRERGRSLNHIVRDHPVAAVVGGLALGVVAAAVLRKGGLGKLARTATALAEAATLTGAALGRDAMEKASAAGEASREFGRHALDRAEAAGCDLLRRGENLAQRAGGMLAPAENAASTAIEAGHRFVRKAGDLMQKARG